MSRDKHGMNSEPQELWEVSHTATRLTNYACEAGARYIKDEALRTQFVQEVAYGSRAVVEGFRTGRLSLSDALAELESQYSILYQEILEYSKLVAGFTAGILQIGTGVAVCKTTLGIGCVAGGIPLILHGVNNMYEHGGNIIGRRKNTIGPVRKGYQRLSEFAGGRPSHGNLAYGVTDIGLSGFGLARMVLKAGSWRLFRYIEADKVRAYKEMGKGSLMFEIGIDMLTGEQVLVEWDNL